MYRIEYDVEDKEVHEINHKEFQEPLTALLNYDRISMIHENAKLYKYNEVIERENLFEDLGNKKKITMNAILVKNVAGIEEKVNNILSQHLPGLVSDNIVINLDGLDRLSLKSIMNEYDTFIVDMDLTKDKDMESFCFICKIAANERISEKTLININESVNFSTMEPSNRLDFCRLFTKNSLANIYYQKNETDFDLISPSPEFCKP